MISMCMIARSVVSSSAAVVVHSEISNIINKNKNPKAKKKHTDRTVQINIEKRKIIIKSLQK